MILKVSIYLRKNLILRCKTLPIGLILLLLLLILLQDWLIRLQAVLVSFSVVYFIVIRLKRLTMILRLVVWMLSLVVINLCVLLLLLVMLLVDAVLINSNVMRYLKIIYATLLLAIRTCLLPYYILRNFVRLRFHRKFYKSNLVKQNERFIYYPKRLPHETTDLGKDFM